MVVVVVAGGDVVATATSTPDAMTLVNLATESLTENHVILN
jgi:hypothetical protein